MTLDNALKLTVPALWLVFCAYWWIRSRNQKSARVAEPWLTRFLRHWLPLGAAIVLIAGPGDWFGHSLLREQFLPHTTLVYAIGVLVMLAGLILAIWARRTLGRNWSANVQIKQDHELVTDGPYATVRHPIYTALILMFIGNAIVVGDVRAILGVLIVWASFAVKSRREEQFMLSEFGEPYAQYRQRTGGIWPRLFH
ncbi:methyltransferase family protein [Aquilutibacter rugosus]|uniref:methyltransferase family protein n=1 Tax=Aquilutibacter rugosus TaxID=3115820 RepID=UPI002F3E7082